MVRWGTVLWDNGALWGDNDWTTAEQNAWDALAGRSPAYPAHAPVQRDRCAEIWTFNPLTWTPTAQLAYVARGGVRQAQTVGIGFQQESLTFPISNAQHYYDNPGAMANLAPGAWLCVRWEVASNLAATTHLGGVFRVSHAPTRESLVNASSFQVTAVDWLQPTLARQSLGNGWVTWGAADLAQVEEYIDAGGTGWDAWQGLPMDEHSWGTVLAAKLAILAQPNVGALNLALSRVDLSRPWPTWGPAPLAGSTFNAGMEATFGTDSPPEHIQIADPLKRINLYDYLTYLWNNVGGFYLGYVTETGYLVPVPGGNQGRSSGTFITSDNTVTGTTPLPWQGPLVRNLSKPEATKVIYYLNGPRGNTPASSMEVEVVEGDPFRPRGEAVSSHPLFPHDGTLNNELEVVEEWPAKVTVGFSTYSDWCRWRLRQALSAADTVALAVDAAYPPPPLGTLVRVFVGDDADGWYQLVGFTQPLSEAWGSWQLRWWSNA